jgi:hypothetical protein
MAKPYKEGSVTHPNGGKWTGGDMKHPGQTDKASTSSDSYKRSPAIKKGAQAGGK